LFFLTAALILPHTYAQAQRKIQYGFELGGGLAIQHISNPDILSINAIRTFHINAIINIPVLKDYYISLKPGLTNKGAVVTEDALVTNNHITYYQLTANLMRKYDIPTLGKIVGGIGGYFSRGDYGSLDYETPNSSNSDYVAFGDNNDFQRYDGGINVFTGLELNNKLIFHLGYDFGLTNIASQALKDTGTSNVFNREFTISLGFMIK